MKTKNRTIFALYLTITEKQQLEARAKRAGLSLNSYIRIKLGFKAMPRTKSSADAARAGRLGGLKRAANLSAEEKTRLAKIAGSTPKGKRERQDRRQDKEKQLKVFRRAFDESIAQKRMEEE